MRQSWVAALLLLGCAFGSHRDAGPRGNPDDALARLDQAEAAAKGDPSRLARAGWLRYLIASDARGAESRLRQAAQAGAPSGRALALAGLGELAEDRLDTSAAVARFIEALQAAPRDPIAELAAIRLLDLEGETRQTDDAIAAAADALPVPMAPRAARFVREAAARIAGRRAQQLAKPAAEVEAWRRVGAVQRWRVGGPFAALRLADLSRQLALDSPVAATARNFDRALEFPDGDAGLDGEPGEGDVFYAASDVTLARGGYYLLWIEGAGALEARVDGAVAISRVPYPLESPRAQTAAIRLAPGSHRVLVRWSRAEGNRFRLVLARADGAPSDATSAAPAELSGARAASLCELGRPCVAGPAWKDGADLRAAAGSMLEKDESDALAAFLLARATLADDRSAARVAVAKALALTHGGAPALALRAQLLLHDPEVPDRIGRGRALADLDEANRKDPRLLRARLTAAALDRESERYEDAAQELDKVELLLREEKQAVPARVLVARARLLDARGNAAAARARVQEALRSAEGRCDALQLALDLSRRGAALAEQRRAAEAVLPCADGVGTLAQSLRDRGELARAEELLKLASALRPASAPRLERLADVQAARKDLPAAVASIRRAIALSPRDPDPLRRLAGLLELEGEGKAATEARRAALQLAPGDLGIRQQVALDEGARVLAWTDRDALAMARTARTGEVPEGASAVRLLDYGAVQIFPDRGGVERIHTLVRVLDKKGVSRFGEAQIPGEAQVLHLRTIKADGRVLEPESIPEKEGISLPGLEPGDCVEVDYLRGISPRGPDLPGFTLGAFYFRDEEVPMRESTYEVRAPGAFEVDAHNLQLPPGSMQRQGDDFSFRYSARNVVPMQPEPHQPGEAELMPWVQIGSGATQKELIRSYADWVLLRTRPGSATLELARKAIGRSRRETAERIFAAVAQAVRGRSTGTDFGASAAHVLAQGRGNRLVALKAALGSAQIPSHIVLARTFNADPAPYRFPRGEVFGYALLRIDLPEGPIWVDPTYRLAPFGQLPAYARGEPAWVMPEPGEEPVQIRTPDSPGQQDGRSLALDLTLAPDGTASGTGRDEHRGFEAASLKDALERLDRDQRKQAIESMLGRGLRGVSLEALSTEHETDLGGVATLIYDVRFELGRRDGEQLFVQGSAVPSRLTRRWAPAAERTVPLLIDSPEILTARTALALPQGKHLRNGPRPVALNSAFGHYSFQAREEAGKLILEESLEVPQQRISPAQYPAFAAFARAVDQAQSGELQIAP